MSLRASRPGVTLLKSNTFVQNYCKSVSGHGHMQKVMQHATRAQVTVKAQTMAGSIPWMAPEVVRNEGYSRPADIWALGGLIIEM